jgi:hypothetical protein
LDVWKEATPMRTRYLLPWLASAILLLSLLPSQRLLAAPSVDERFRAYYQQHQGLRLLGYPLTGLIEANGFVAQYFEKGRLEDHRAEQAGPEWAFMYGRLTAELLEQGAQRLVTNTSLTYPQLQRYHEPAARRPVPERFASGTAATADGTFVPFDPYLRPAPGYVVPDYFWTYITRAELFPGGWLHDIGLPMTAAIPVSAFKQGSPRQIVMQAFERAILTYDPQNAPEWQVERGNIGTDMVQLLPPANTIELPTADAWVTLPLHVLARVGRVGEQLTSVLRWENGAELKHTNTLVRGEDGRGLLISSLDLVPEQQSLQPWTQAARLEIRDARGAVLARQALRVLHRDDPDTRAVWLYWQVGDSLKGELRRVPKAAALGTAALDELLWGPAPRNAEGFKSAIPSPAEVLAFGGRTGAWGPRVVLRSATLVDGVVRADFSRELAAYGGNSLRASLIHAQITRTLSQFEDVRDVRITIEGQRDPALEP